MSRENVLLFLDHRDSFSANLATTLRCAGADLDIVQSDSLPADSSDLEKLSCRYSGLVLSPGPGTPSDWPRSSQILELGFGGKPVLGVCMGLQILLNGSGLVVERLHHLPVHGRQSSLTGEHLALRLRTNEGLPFRFDGKWVFYNSLACHASGELCRQRGWEVLAREGESIAAVEHRERPHVAVQFHPESFASVKGQEFLGAFVRFAQNWRMNHSTDILV
jgi:anthranilate/para-aminobenzoate synthase component II